MFGVFVIVLIVWVVGGMIYGVANNLNKEKEKKQAQEQRIFIKEREQCEIAHLKGLNKYHRLDVQDAKDYQEGIEAMRLAGAIMQQSVYQEKKRDWAIWGGIADGLAGPVAGIATALDTMRENERIEAENAARREWGAKQNAFYQDLAAQASKQSPTALTMSQLENKYEVITSWSPDTLLSLLSFSNTRCAVDSTSGVVTVSAEWVQSDKSLCIDGALRAKLYTNGKCVGCAYLVLPKTGTAGFKGELSGLCTSPKIRSNYYSVKIEPVDLWELAPKGNMTNRKTDNLTYSEHMQIVANYERKYLTELHKTS